MLSHSLKVTPQITMYFLWWQDIHMALNQYWVPFAHLYLTCFPCTLSYLINDVLTGAIFFLLLLLLSGLLSMQWIAEVVTLNQALSQYGHLVQWWMTREQKVLSPIIFWDSDLLYSSLFNIAFFLASLSCNHSLPEWLLIHYFVYCALTYAMCTCKIAHYG